MNAKYCCVIGTNEMNDGTIWIKDLQNKKEFILKREEF